MRKQYQIIIPDGDGPMPLVVARCLASLPTRFTLLASNRSYGTHWSRFCDRHIVSDPNNELDQLEQLLALEDSGCPEILLPITTEGFQFVSRNREALKYRFALPPIAAVENLQTASDKWKLYDFCLQNDLPVLRSIPIAAILAEGMESGSSLLTFPVLVKSRAEQGGAGFRKVETPQALQALRKEIGSEKEEDFFVQRFVDGEDVSLSVFCEQGEIKSFTLWRAISYGNIKYRMPVCVEFIEEDRVLAIGQQLLKLLNWEGVCDIDFFVDRHTREVWLLEINARFWGTVVACEIAGINFAQLMCERALSREEREWPKPRKLIYCHPQGLLQALRVPKARREILRHPLRNTGLDKMLLDSGPVWYQLLAKTKWAIVQYLKGFRKPKEGEPDQARRNSWRHVAGVTFLGLQLFAIGYARFIPERFFCWAPYDEHTHYQIEVVIDERILSDEEIAVRYRYPAEAWEVRAIRNVISLVRQYERTYGESDQAEVRIHYETNGHPQETWTWPEN